MRIKSQMLEEIEKLERRVDALERQLSEIEQETKPDRNVVAPSNEYLTEGFDPSKLEKWLGSK